MARKSTNVADYMRVPRPIAAMAKDAVQPRRSDATHPDRREACANTKQ
jgi:hypothetical protein